MAVKRGSARKRKRKAAAPATNGATLVVDTVEMIDPATLNEAEYNPREITAEALKRLQTIIEHHGFVNPIIVNKINNTVIGGNQRLKAAIAMGMAKVPVVFVSKGVEDEKALNVALNAEYGVFEKERMMNVLASLTPAGYDLNMSGFNPAQFNSLLGGDWEKQLQNQVNGIASKEPEEEIIPELPKNPKTKLGQIYEMGLHQLMCGDCRKSKDMGKLFGNNKINVCVTSPPYASQRKYDESSGFKPIHPNKYVEWFDGVQSGIKSHISDDGSFFLNIKEHAEDGQRHLYVKDLTLAMVREFGWRFVDEFVWTHGGTPKAVQQRFKNGWEPIFQFTQGRHAFYPDNVLKSSGGSVDWDGQGLKYNPDNLGFKKNGQVGKSGHPNEEKKQGRKNTKLNIESQGKPEYGKEIYDVVTANTNGWAYPSNSLSFGKNREALGHAAAYPVNLPDFFIRAYSEENDIIFDPFMGSGSTLMAAENNSRIGYGMELSPGYCDVIVERWQNATGKKAKKIRQ